MTVWRIISLVWAPFPTCAADVGRRRLCHTPHWKGLRFADFKVSKVEVSLTAVWLLPRPPTRGDLFKRDCLLIQFKTHKRACIHTIHPSIHPSAHPPTHPPTHASMHPCRHIYRFTRMHVLAGNVDLHMMCAGSPKYAQAASHSAGRFLRLWQHLWSAKSHEQDGKCRSSVLLHITNPCNHDPVSMALAASPNSTLVAVHGESKGSCVRSKKRM